MARIIEGGETIGDATFPKGWRTFVERFDAPEDYHKFLQTVPRNDYYRNDRSGWGGGGWDASTHNLLNGSTQRLEQAEKLIEDMNDHQVFTTGMPYYAPAVVGAFPNVPAYIIGEPLDMYAKKDFPSESNTSPLIVWVETVVSGGRSLSELNARGVCALAFAMAMNKVRPTQVYAVSALGGHSSYTTSVISVRIESTPLDLGRAVFMLTDEAYARNLNFAASNTLMGNQSTGNWAWGGYPTSDEYQQCVRAAVEAEKQDVYIPGGHLTDSLMLRNPIKWVKNMIAKHGGADPDDLDTTFDIDSFLED